MRTTATGATSERKKRLSPRAMNPAAISGEESLTSWPTAMRRAVNERLGRLDEVAEVLAFSTMLPAIGQMTVGTLLNSAFVAILGATPWRCSRPRDARKQTGTS